MSKIEVIERPIDKYRNLEGRAKSEFYRKNKEAIIAQGLDKENRRRDREEFLNGKKD